MGDTVMNPLIGNKAVKIVCLALLVLASWIAFFYTLSQTQDKDILGCVGFVVGIVTFFGFMMISEE